MDIEVMKEPQSEVAIHCGSSMQCIELATSYQDPSKSTDTEKLIYTVCQKKHITKLFTIPLLNIH